MPRDLPLSNGKLLVAFGRDYLIQDIYYPHVGKENHATGHPFRFGVWAAGRFSWMGPEWQPDRRYYADSMVSEVRARHESPGVELLCHGAEGTWRDAEDGELQGNPIAQGSVDSTLGISLTVPARGSAEADYWMAAGRDFREVATIDRVVRDKSPGELLRRTRNYWRLWV